MNKSNIIVATILSLGFVIAAIFFSDAVKSFRKQNKSIDVTGMAEYNFTSDLIVWEATFSETSMNMKDAYAALKKDQDEVKAYLKENKVPEECITFSSVDIQPKNEQIWTRDHYETYFRGYSLTQTVTISSTEVDHIEKVSREVTELIDKGINIQSMAPRYYYTKLNDLKIKLLEEASQNAYNRAEVIANGSKSKLGELLDSQSGVFQIVGLNSNEDYSWGGSFNTSSKEKTASITVKASYKIR